MPSSVSSLEQRARAFAVAQDFGPEALDLNRRLVAANPADEGARTRLARCHLHAGHVDQAEAEYREALLLNPRNRIALGGLEEIEKLKHPPEARNPARAGSRARRTSGTVFHRSEPGGAATGSSRTAARGLNGDDAAPAPTFTEPVPETFTGFGPAEFDELARCRRRDVQERFGPRVIDLVRRVNALGCCVEMAGVRESGKRQMFRTGRADLHATEAHWHVLSFGGRAEPQCNIGMDGGRAIGNWLRIGLAFDLGDDAGDFPRFQQLVASPRGSLFLGWMIKEDARPQIGHAPPRVDVHEPAEAASLIAAIDPARTRWVFFGKWLKPEDSDAAAVLRDPVTLVRTIDRVFSGLLPLWRALFEG